MISILDERFQNKCAKRTVIAVIMKDNELISFGLNWVRVPQKDCPRIGLKTGEGYELCKYICKQYAHAEVDACLLAGTNAKGSDLYLIGHYKSCKNCIDTMKSYGIKTLYICETNERVLIENYHNIV